MVEFNRVGQMITVYPKAKINIGLNVVSKRDDGYHNLETVFYPINIHDVIDITESNQAGCDIDIEGANLACDPQQNLVVKAYNIIREHYDIPGVKVTLNKMIPSQAGMGGGSSDAAYMIKALDEMFSIGMSDDEMRLYASKLGADCAFFINPVPSYAEGIGDKLSPVSINGLDDKFLALVKPGVAVSTKEAYAGITPSTPKKCCKDIVAQPIETWANELRNDFEDSVFRSLPILGEVKKDLYNRGAIYASMSGSGSTIYGIFEERPLDVLYAYPDYYTMIIKL